MKRPIVLISIVALSSALLVALLHASGVLSPLENSLARLMSPGPISRTVPGAWQYLFILLVAAGVAYLALMHSRRDRVGGLVAAFTVELLCLMAVCALFHLQFQALPSILAAFFSYGGSLAAIFLPSRTANRTPVPAAEERISSAQRERMRQRGASPDRTARFCDGTAVVCDLAGKFDLAETLDPAAVVKASASFTSRVRASLLQAGAFIYRADPEGVVAVFGLLETDDHARKAVAAAFELVHAFSSADGNGEAAPNVHIGISTGALVANGSPEDHDFFLLGEPVELARRFCVANRAYGSRILIGPRTFEQANDAYVSRPIDFLSGENAQQRYEVYEPLAPAADAPRELLARRDYFWNGVVLYREKRWGEAYAEFQKARSPGDENDAPLQLYLRRLEPLALHLVDGEG